MFPSISAVFVGNIRTPDFFQTEVWILIFFLGGMGEFSKNGWLIGCVGIPSQMYFRKLEVDVSLMKDELLFII